MGAKEELKMKFSSDPYRYYHVKLFDELGFKRKKCRCGKYFWSLVDRDNCPDSSCTPYGFIGNTPAKIKGDYVQIWKSIEKYFIKNGHASVPSYPTVCRWFPGLYFNIASITSFQRSIGGKTVFEFPSNPLIIPQTCMRFNDIPNVGVSGRHLTSFIMIGQHSKYDPKTREGYWKDKCIDLDWGMLTKVLKIPAEEISFIEDVWLGPEAFGYSLEYFVRGLELGNAVFTEFIGTPENYKQMDKKIIDMGAGHERLVWISSGTPTSYDAVFGPVIKKVKKLVDYDDYVFSKYSRVSSVLNADEAGFDEGRKMVEKELGMKYNEIRKSIEQLEAAYAITDHTKTLLYAIVDGQLPNNVGGGYNLRLILRRSLGFIERFGLDIDLFDVCKQHSKFLKPIDKRLSEGLDEVSEILDVEKRRYFETKKRSAKIMENILDRKIKIGEDKLIELYESNGITPEMLKSFADRKGIDLELPVNIYKKMSHGDQEKQIMEKNIDVSELPKGEMLFYKDQNVFEFETKVLKIIDNKIVILETTYFYGRSGGQEPDFGTINSCRVHDVERIGKHILHHVENVNFKEGDIVKCIIDKTRRHQLMLHHSGTHVLTAASRDILGKHVWQHSALKNVNKARLDITHYELLDDKILDKIEKLANNVIKKKYVVKKYFLNRTEAERKFGFILYQGGAAPEKNLRIVEIRDKKNKLYDVEACGGIHVDNTKEIENLIILKQERIQDGVVRFIFACGPAAKKELQNYNEIIEKCKHLLNSSDKLLVADGKKLINRWKRLRKLKEQKIEKDAESAVNQLQKKFANNILIEKIENSDMKELQKISKILSGDDKIVILFGLNDKIFVFASAGQKAVKEGHVDIGEIVSNICKELDGKGGGSKNLGQGIGNNKSVLDGVIKKVREHFHM